MCCNSESQTFYALEKNFSWLCYADSVCVVIVFNTSTVTPPDQEQAVHNLLHHIRSMMLCVTVIVVKDITLHITSS